MQVLNKNHLQEQQQNAFLIGNVDVGDVEDHTQVFSSSSTIINDKQTLEEQLLLSSPSKILNEREKPQNQHADNDFDLPLARSSLIFYNNQSFDEQQLLNKKFTKYEITPEYISNLPQQQSVRREKILWANNPRTLKRNPSKEQTFELTNTASRSFDSTYDMSQLNTQNKIILKNGNFDEDYNTYIESGYVESQDKKEDVSQLLDNILRSDEDTEFIPTSNRKLIKNQSVEIQTDNNKQQQKKTKIKRTRTKHRVNTADQVQQSLKQSPREQQLRAITAVRQPLSSFTHLVNGNGGDMTKTSAMKTARDIVCNDEVNTKHLISVDTSKAKSNLDVVRMCVKELGWKECALSTVLDSDIYWHSSTFNEGNQSFAFNSGRVNKFPGMNDILRKVHLTRSLNVMRSLYPAEYDFYPKTWFIPEQSEQFRDDVRYIHEQDQQHKRSLTTFIVKPSDGSQGEGIYLIRNPSSCIMTNRPHVIQEYIDRPLLINGLKFDLRIYVLILNLYPLELFLYDEGLARFATIDYKAPATENLHQTFMHLTNYSLNKKSATYKHTINDKQTDGSKRKLSVVWNQLIKMYGQDKIDKTKLLITELINKTIIAILPELRIEYEFELPMGKKQNISCFQIVGFDIILTDKLKPILLEVNANPSLRMDFEKETELGRVIYQPSPIDEEIKKPLVLETLKLALPKKKLHTIARHYQFQLDEEAMTQRLEKVAQRRVDERSEKIRSIRLTRFDAKHNPYFSRPLKEFRKDDEEQQQQNKKVLLNPFTLVGGDNGKEDEDDPFLTSYNRTDEPKMVKRKKLKANNKKQLISNDDHESGENGANQSISTMIESDEKNLSPHEMYLLKKQYRQGLTANNGISGTTKGTKLLKLIYPSTYKSKYRQMFLLDKIAYIYIKIVVMMGHKRMTATHFRNFAQICGIMNDFITRESVDILYVQMLRKWQQFVLKTSSPGLPFAAFLEAFFLLSQRKFPSTKHLLDSVTQLATFCIRHLNTFLQSPNGHYLMPRVSRNGSNSNQNVDGRHEKRIYLHRLSTASPNHGITSISKDIVPTTISTTGLSVNQDTLMRTGTRRISTSLRDSKRSVFPLFFEVL